jgi:ribulose-phosphate 3-epimerase
MRRIAASSVAPIAQLSALPASLRCTRRSSPRDEHHPGSTSKLGLGVAWEDWIRTVEVEPSVYAADFARLGEQVDLLLRAGARVFHFDVGDGHFVEPITIGPIVLKDIAPRVHAFEGGAMDCHLMVDNPTHHFPQIAQAGGDSVTFHYEVVDDVPATIAAARALGLGAGVAFNPETEPEDVARVAGTADLVLCMSIRPGYSGQAFRPESPDRIARLRKALPERVHIQVDGGINLDNARAVHEAGARLLVAGSSIFAHGDPAAAYRGLVQVLH